MTESRPSLHGTSKSPARTRAASRTEPKHASHKPSSWRCTLRHLDHGLLVDGDTQMRQREAWSARSARKSEEASTARMVTVRRCVTNIVYERSILLERWHCSLLKILGKGFLTRPPPRAPADVVTSRRATVAIEENDATLQVLAVPPAFARGAAEGRTWRRRKDATDA